MCHELHFGNGSGSRAEDDSGDEGHLAPHIKGNGRSRSLPRNPLRRPVAIVLPVIYPGNIE
jgi:hypothetical protein